MRSFTSGATRDTNEGKLDYEGFLSPVVLKQFARFMNMNRLQSDGKLRDSDNWQKGIPMDVYRKSLFRHYMEFWEETRHQDQMGADFKSRLSDINLVSAACGMMFNTMGYLLEWLKENEEVRFDDDEPTTEMAARRKKINESDVADVIDTMAEKVHQLIDFPKEDSRQTYPATVVDMRKEQPLYSVCAECDRIRLINSDCICTIPDLEEEFEEKSNDEPGLGGEFNETFKDDYCEECGWQECECAEQQYDCKDEFGPVSLTEVSPDYLKRTSVVCEIPACTCEACETSRKMKGIPEPTVRGCADCRFEDQGWEEHPCDCCNSDYDNYSPADDHM